MTRAYRFLGPMVRVVVGTAANEFQRKTGIRVGLTLEGIAGKPSPRAPRRRPRSRQR